MSTEPTTTAIDALTNMVENAKDVIARSGPNDQIKNWILTRFDSVLDLATKLITARNAQIAALTQEVADLNQRLDIANLTAAKERYVAEGLGRRLSVWLLRLEPLVVHAETANKGRSVTICDACNMFCDTGTAGSAWHATDCPFYAGETE